MRVLILPLAILFTGPVLAADCSGYTAMIASETDVRVGPAIGPKTILVHPAATNLSLECQDGEPVNVAGSVKAANPADFLRVVTKAAAYGLAIPEKDLRTLVAECQVRGMRTPNNLVEATGKGATVKCFVAPGYEAVQISPRP